MLESVKKVIGVHVTINSLNRKFQLETEVTKVDCGTLLSLDNPRYAEVIDKYPHLTGVCMIRDKTQDWTSRRACDGVDTVWMDNNVTRKRN